MTAKEARELTEGSMKRKGKWFQFRLAWMCGVLNKKIENASEQGETGTTYEFRKTSWFRKYYPIMEKLYKERGFIVSGSTAPYYATMYVYWDERTKRK